MRLQLIKTAFWGVVALAAIAIAGLIGYHQGFARAVGINDLERSITALLADGVLMIRNVPGDVFQAGLSGTGEWMLATASAIGAAGVLALALLARGGETVRPASTTTSDQAEPDGRSPGRKRPTKPPAPSTTAGATDGSPRPPGTLDDDERFSFGAFMIMSGLALAILAAIVHFGWTISRHHRLGEKSIFDAGAEMVQWIESTQIAAGIDVIALAATVLWLLIALHLHGIFGWLKVLAVTSCACAVALGFAAASVSVGTLTQMNQSRPVAAWSNMTNSPAQDREAGVDSSRAMLLGRSATHLVLLRDSGEPVFVPSNQILIVQSRESLPEFLTRIHMEDEPSDSATANAPDSDNEGTGP